MQHPISFSLLPFIHPFILSSLSFPIFIFVSIFLFISYSCIPQARQALWQLPRVRYTPLDSLLREMAVEPDQCLLRTRLPYPVPTVCLLSPQPSKGPQLSSKHVFFFFVLPVFGIFPKVPAHSPGSNYKHSYFLRLFLELLSPAFREYSPGWGEIATRLRAPVCQNSTMLFKCLLCTGMTMSVMKKMTSNFRA